MSVRRPIASLRECEEVHFGPLAPSEIAERWSAGVSPASGGAGYEGRRIRRGEDASP